MAPKETLSQSPNQTGANLDALPQETEALQDDLTQMAKAFARQKRQIDRLVKLSDANEARLTDANETLSSLTRNLSRFVPRTVVEQLMKGGDEQLASTERREITVFFSDIIGFTEMTERLAPEKLAALMSDYFTEMSAICDLWGGTLDQFIGDAVVIFFGAPTSQSVQKDARRAIMMALDMQERLVALRESWASKGYVVPLHVRIGLATGYCNVGNFGSDTRLHYTALGGTMNEAARIQALCPKDGILVSESCYLQAKDDFAWENKGATSLKGHAHPSLLFQPARHVDKATAAADNAPISHAQEGLTLHASAAEITDKDSAIAALEAVLMQLRQSSK